MTATVPPATLLPQLRIDTSHPSPGTTTVVVVGEVDLLTAPVLYARLLGVAYERATDVIEVDLAGVTFLDCAGLRALVSAYHAAVHTGHRLRVTHRRPMVQRILEATGLLDLLTSPASPRPPTTHAVAVPLRAPTRSTAVPLRTMTTAA